MELANITTAEMILKVVIRSELEPFFNFVRSRFKTLFLKVFHPITIHLYLGLISCNLTTRCLAVTGGGSVCECDRLN